MNNRSKKIYKIYNSWRKFLIGFLCFVFTIASIKVYINNFLGIQESLYGIDSEIVKTKLKISYYQNYKIPYLKSEFAVKFLKHQNGLPQEDGELIIKLQKDEEKFDKIPISNTGEKVKKEDIIINTREDFRIYKFKKGI